MKLTTAGSIGHTDVTEEQLKAAFADDYGRGEFIILEQDPQTYIQAAGEYDGPFTLDYREGDAEHHFTCISEVSKEEAQKAFVKYLHRDSSWKKDFDWKKLEVKSKPWWKIW